MKMAEYNNKTNEELCSVPFYQVSKPPQLENMVENMECGPLLTASPNNGGLDFFIQNLTAVPAAVPELEVYARKSKPRRSKTKSPETIAPKATRATGRTFRPSAGDPVKLENRGGDQQAMRPPPATVQAGAPARAVPEPNLVFLPQSPLPPQAVGYTLDQAYQKVSSSYWTFSGLTPPRCPNIRFPSGVHPPSLGIFNNNQAGAGMTFRHVSCTVRQCSDGIFSVNDSAYKSEPPSILFSSQRQGEFVNSYLQHLAEFVTARVRDFPSAVHSLPWILESFEQIKKSPSNLAFMYLDIVQTGEVTAFCQRIKLLTLAKSYSDVSDMRYSYDLLCSDFPHCTGLLGCLMELEQNTDRMNLCPWYCTNYLTVYEIDCYRRWLSLPSLDKNPRLMMQTGQDLPAPPSHVAPWQ